jgi:hypothetical protein
MKRILIGLAATAAAFFAASAIVVATIGNTSHGWKAVVGGIAWFGFLFFASAFVVTAIAALVRSRFGRAATTTALVSLALVATAAAGPRGEQLRISIYSANVRMKDTPMLVQAVGAFDAIGTAIAKDETRGPTVPLTLRFRNGTVFMKSVDPFRWQPDLGSCTATEHSVGTWRITGGTGAYRGLTGHGTFVEHGAGIGVRSTTGACLQRFALNYVLATATGTALRRS